jgi:hypothetical protein
VNVAEKKNAHKGRIIAVSGKEGRGVVARMGGRMRVYDSWGDAGVDSANLRSGMK